MSQKPPQSLGNIFFLHIPKRVEDTLLVDGQELYFDGSYAEHFNKKLGGVVVAEPGILGDEYLLGKRTQWSDNVTCSAIQDDVRLGDVLWVDWTVTEPHFELPGFGKVYRASANQVVARVREGELIPYGSYVLCKPIYPEGVEDVEVGGHTLKLRVSASGLALGSESIPPVPFQGEAVLVGRPLRGQPQRVRPGDRLVFHKDFCGKAEGLPLKMKIEGVEYLCIRQDHIVAVLETVPEIPPMPEPREFWFAGLSAEERVAFRARLRQAWADQHRQPAASAAIPQGYNYNPEAIERHLHQVGYSQVYGCDVAEVVEAHRAELKANDGSQYMNFMGHNIIAELIELGAITQNS